MDFRTLREWRQWAVFPLLMLIITALVHFACLDGSDQTTTSPESYAQQCAQPFDQVVVDCPALPEALPTYNFQDKTPTAAEYENFAWRSFIALNWPARIPSNQTSPAFARGFPDYSKTFLTAAHDDVGVWESWREKRELFFYGTNLSAPEPTPNPPEPPPWNGPTDYGNDAYEPPIEPCPGSGLTVADYHRVLGKSGKTDGFNSLDEAVEVPSQANPDPSVTGKVAGAAVEPRVFELVDGELVTVLFEVKLNYDYYHFVRQNGLYQDSVAVPRAAANGQPGQPTINFPCRGLPADAAHQCAKLAGADQPPQDYSVEQCVMQNADLSDAPCATGTIQTKSGWKLLTDAEIQSEAFHTTEAIYYVAREDVPGGICLASGQFGLIGFHIIQKTEGQGHYLYATWEHSDNDQAGFVYSNYFPGGVVNGQNVSAGFYPPLNETLLPVKREAGRILSGTQQTNKIFHQAFGCDGASPPVWCNYRLIGTQFVPLDARAGCAENPTSTDCNTPYQDFGQPFYLANLVVETNWGLQNFQGAPPGLDNGNVAAAFTPTQGYLQGRNGSRANYVANPTITFNRSLYNLGYHRMASQPDPAGQQESYGAVFTMGGCMGCHGVAQAAGFDFSFVLKKGQGGSKPETANGTPEG